MVKKELEKVEDFKHGDLICVTSFERNCGIDETVFTAIVVDSKEYGLIAIPQDFHGHLYNAAIKGACWETSIEWLLENDVKILLIERFDDLINMAWN